MSIRFPIDRFDEFKAFEELLEPNTAKRIMLLEAKTGKTILLERFLKHLTDKNYQCAYVDLAHGGWTIIDLLSTLCDQLDWRKFSEFQRMCEKLSSGSNVDLHGVAQVGFGNKAQLIVNKDKNRYAAEERMVTNCWFEDVQNWLKPHSIAFILIDSYNLRSSNDSSATVSPELTKWLEGVFLLRLKQCKNLRLILAGQDSPKLSLTWSQSCNSLKLGPILDIDEWRRFVTEGIGKNKVSQQQIEFILHLVKELHGEKGHPLYTALFLSTLRTLEEPNDG